MAQKPLNIGQFAALIAAAGGRIVAFGDPTRGVHYDETAIRALIEEENGRSNQEEEGAVRGQPGPT